MNPIPGGNAGRGRTPGPLIGLSALLGLAPLVVCPTLHSFSELPQRLWLVIGGGLILIWQTVAGRRAGRIARPAGLVGSMLAGWCAWLALAGFFAPIKPLALAAGLNWLILPLIAWPTLGLIEKEADAARLLVGPGLGLTAVAGLGLVQALGLIDAVPQVTPPAATLANKNLAAHLVVAGLPWLVFMGRRSRGWLRLAWSTAALVGAAFIAVAQSTTALIAALTGLIVTAVGLRPGRPAWLGLSAWLIAVGCGAAWLMWPVGGAATSEWDRLSASAAIRRQMWRDALAMWRDAPLLGQGPGHYNAALPRFHRQRPGDRVFNLKTQPRRAHNDFLQLSAETGLGGLLLIGLLAAAFLGLIAPRRAGPERGPAEAWGRAAVGGSLAAWVVIACFSFPLAMPSSTAHLGLDLGLAAALGGRVTAGGRGWRWAAGLVGLVAVAAGIGLLGRQTAADYYLKRSQLLSAGGRAAEAAAALERADDLNLWDRKIPFQRALTDLSRGRAEPAEAGWLEVLALSPGHPNALFNLALTRLALGREAEALRAAEKAVEILPYEPSLWRLVWRLQGRLGRGDESRRAAEAAVARRPDDASAWYRLGFFHYLEGGYDQAATALSAALGLAVRAGGPADLIRQIKPLLAEARRRAAEATRRKPRR